MGGEGMSLLAPMLDLLTDSDRTWQEVDQCRARTAKTVSGCMFFLTFTSLLLTNKH